MREASGHKRYTPEKLQDLWVTYNSKQYTYHTSTLLRNHLEIPFLFQNLTGINRQMPVATTTQMCHGGVLALLLQNLRRMQNLHLLQNLRLLKTHEGRPNNTLGIMKEADDPDYLVFRFHFVKIAQQALTDEWCYLRRGTGRAPQRNGPRCSGS